MSFQPFLSVLVTPLITALLSGIVAALVSSYLSEGKERWAIRREKIEQIYLASITFGNGLFSYFNLYYPVIKGQVGLNELNDAHSESAASGDDFRKLQMNILLYEPTLIDAWNEVVAARDKVGGIVLQMRGSFKAGDDLRFYSRPFHAAVAELVSKLKALETAVTERGREIAKEKGQAESLLLTLRSMPSRTVYGLGTGSIRGETRSRDWRGTSISVVQNNEWCNALTLSARCTAFGRYVSSRIDAPHQRRAPSQLRRAPEASGRLVVPPLPNQARARDAVVADQPLHVPGPHARADHPRAMVWERNG